MDKDVDFVNAQIRRLRRIIERSYGRSDYKPGPLERTILSFEDVRARLESQSAPQTEAGPQKDVPDHQSHVRPDLSDLPPELLKELSGTTVHGESDPLVDLINDRGGVASLDEILIDLYRKHGEIGKRNLVTNKLYRLTRRGLLWAAPGRKGIYSTSPDGVSGEKKSEVVSLFDREVGSRAR